MTCISKLTPFTGGGGLLYYNFLTISCYTPKFGPCSSTRLL